MPTSWHGVHVKCPFYRIDDRSMIECEGVTARCHTSLRFSSEKEKNRYMTCYCDTSYYEACGVYAAVMKKYK